MCLARGRTKIDLFAFVELDRLGGALDYADEPSTTPAPRAGVVGRFVAAESTPFVGIDASVAWVVPLGPVGPAWALDGFAGGGYASSLTAQVDGRRTLGLDGWFATAVLGVRFPEVF